MRRPTIRLFALLILQPLLAGGCARPAAPAATQPAAPPPLVIHFPGVSGPTSFDHRYVQVLRQAMPDADVRMIDWTANDPGLGALRATARNHEQARRQAEHLVERFRADRRLTIYLSGHSGGTAIAVWLLENLPADVKVESVLLLASALSPGYDLGPALSHVNGRVHAFHSPGDKVVLGAGTRLMGTMDGPRTDAAGFVGFRPPPAADRSLYAKLVQHAYQDQWRRLGHIGDHVGVLAVPFVRQVLLPLWLNLPAS